MLTSVRPAVKEGETRVTMGVLGRRAEDIDEFMEKLEATGAFDDILPAAKDRTEDGLHRVTLESIYTGVTDETAAEAAPAQAPRPEAAGFEGAPVTPARRVLREKRRLIWPIAIALILNAALYAIVVYPLSKKVAGGEQAAEASALALQAARRDYDAAKATIAGKDQADVELQKFYGEVLPPDVSGARRITFLRIEQLAAQCDLRLERETSNPDEMRDSQLVKFTYTAALSGEYRNIRRFIHSLETAPEFLVLENVELSQDEQDEQALNVTVQIATYYRAGANGAN